MKSNQKYLLIILAGIIGIAAVYFSLNDVGTTTSEQVATPTESTDQSSVYLTLSDMKGNAVAMDSSKLAFINVWATWCGPCNAEMPSIQKLYDHYRENPKIAFYVVSDENPATVTNFLQKKDYKLPFYLYSGNYPEPLNGNAIPRTYLLRKGEVLIEQVGAINWNDPQVFELIDKELAL
jgi:thiol-disulfide isomerase/thioredoxin